MLIDFRNNGGGGRAPIIESLDITANGTYEAPKGTDGYSPVTVNVPTGGTIDLAGTGWETEEYFPININRLDILAEDIEYTRQKYAEWQAKEDKTTMAELYANDTNLIYAPKIDTSKVTSMSYCFLCCTSLTTIPMLDTSAVTDMYGCFGECSSLTTIPMLDTSAVTEMSYCFQDCRSLTTIPMLDTSAVTYMSYCFRDCNSLTTIPQLNTSAVTDMSDCFYGSNSLTDLGGFTGLKVSLDLNYRDKLTKQSLLNVIAGLATVTDSPTLKLGSTNLAKLTPEEIAVGTAKGWQIVA